MRNLSCSVATQIIGMNVIWVNHEEHAQAVTWWNDLYRSVRSLPSATAEQYSRLW